MFFEWLASYALTATADSVIRQLCKSSLNKEIYKSAEAWRKSLPKGHKLDAIKALLSPQSSMATTQVPPIPETVVNKISNGEIPTEEDWFNALLNNWFWVRSSIIETQSFFNIPETKARLHIQELARLVHAECVKIPELFQQDMHRAVSNINVKVDAIFETISSPAFVKTLTENEPDESKFLSDIEAACKHLKDSQPDKALAIFDQLETNHWGELNSREKYRLHANRGLAYQCKDDFDSASNEFLSCIGFQPKDETARCFEALGYFCKGNKEKCYSLAISILDENNKCSFAHALCLKSAPHDYAFSEIEEAIPEECRKDPEVAHTLADLAASKKAFGSAEKYARLACEKAEFVDQPRLLLAQILICNTAYRASRYMSANPPIDEDPVREAISLLSKTVPILERHRAKDIQAQAHYYLGRGYAMLNEDGNAKHHYANAYNLSPKEKEFITQHAIALHKSNQTDLAIQVISDAISEDQNLEIALLAHDILEARGLQQDMELAISILEDSKATFPSQDKISDTVFLYDLLKCYQLDYIPDKDISWIEEQAKKLDDLNSSIILGAALRIQGKPEARDLISKANLKLNSDTHAMLRNLLAREQNELGLYQDAFAQLRDSVPTDCMSLNTLSLIFSADRAGEDGFLLDFLAKLRHAGVADEGLVDHELSLLERYHSSSDYIELCCSNLDSDDFDESYKQSLRARLSVYSHINEINVDKKYILDIEELPSADSVSSYVGALVVQWLVWSGSIPEARDYSYTLLRNNFDNKHAHRSLIGSFLVDTSIPIPTPSEVRPGTAIQFTDSFGNVNWAIIEDEPKPSSERKEYSHDHHIYKHAIGKKTEESFPLQSTGMTGNKAKILKIEDKKIYRFNACCREWETRFDEFFLVAISMKQDEDGNLDFDPLFEMLRKWEEERERRDNIYKSIPISAAVFANILKEDYYETLNRLIIKGLPVRTCLGSAMELNKAHDYLDTKQPVVLDTSAIAALYVTGNYKHLVSFDTEIVIPRSALLELNRQLDSVRLSSEGELGVYESRLVYQEISPEKQESKLEKLRAFLEWLKDNAEVADGRPLSEIDSDVRSNLLDHFGCSTAEAIAIAATRKVALYTDDVLVAKIGCFDLGIPRVWTQAVVDWAAKTEKIKKHDYHKMTAELLKLGYCHNYLTWQAAQILAEESSYKFNEKSFDVLLKWLADMSVNAKGVRHITEKLLKAIFYNAGNEFTRSTTGPAVLSTVNNRVDGWKIMGELNERINAISGGHVQLSEWLQTSMYHVTNSTGSQIRPH